MKRSTHQGEQGVVLEPRKKSLLARSPGNDISSLGVQLSSEKAAVGCVRRINAYLSAVERCCRLPRDSETSLGVQNMEQGYGDIWE